MAVSISGISGTLTHGQTVTITGSGFGTGLTSVMLFDDFEGGTNGNNITSLKAGASYIIQTSPIPIYSTLHAHSGTKSSYASSANENVSSQYRCPNDEPPDNGTMPDTYYYISFWYKFVPAEVQAQIKIYQLWGTYQVGDYNPGVMYGNPAYGSSEPTWNDK